MTAPPAVRAALAAAALAASAPAGTLAQDMPKEAYYGYVPLAYTRPVRQAAGSADLFLYGNPADPSYRDVDPLDGIDDARHRILQRMGVRFAPYLVLNTTAVPMDWRRFMDGRSSWPLYVDTWNQAVEGGELMREDVVNWLALASDPCPADATPGARPDTDDCRLLALLEEFDPLNPGSEWYTTAAIDPLVDPFKVLYWNFPGHDEPSWTAVYQDPVSLELPRHFWGFPKTYLHPFIEEVRDRRGSLLGYELVLQYWFFYPWNDGGNNHEGDWEHVNIIVAPRGAVTRPQSRDEIAFMLAGGGELASAGDDHVVIKRVDYYFHENVWTLDYARPNVYAPRSRWEAEMDSLPRNRVDQRQIWQNIRERAYEDAEETVVNTHIVGFIGADNKGTDQILARPGGKNRDSHGTYPFQGLYKNVGPAGASEQITAPFDYHRYFDGVRPGLVDGRLGRGSVLRLDRVDRVEIVPDWERIHPFLFTDPEVRERFSWMVLPIRWGYPAAESPFAGVVGHASTGNLAPQSGVQNKGWNRAGAGSGFHEYDPNVYAGFFALGWQDGFRNTWGWFNATIPTLVIVPPIDLITKLIGTPIALLTDQAPTYIDAEDVPFRFFAGELGVIRMGMDDRFGALFLNRDNLAQVLDALGYETGDLPTIPRVSQDVDAGVGPYGRLSFFVGRYFASENAFWAPRGSLSTVVLDADGQERILSGDVKLWEWAGSLRFQLRTERLQPYGKLGYGVTWFRMENASLDGEVLDAPQSETAHPFTWHWGAGVEWLLVASDAAPPRGLDVGLRLEYAVYRHSLSLDTFADPVAQALGQRTSGGVKRGAWSVAVSVGF